VSVTGCFAGTCFLLLPQANDVNKIIVITSKTGEYVRIDSIDTEGRAIGMVIFS